MNFTCTKSSPQNLLLLKQKHVVLAWRLPNYCNVSQWRNNYGLTKKEDQHKKISSPPGSVWMCEGDFAHMP